MTVPDVVVEQRPQVCSTRHTPLEQAAVVLRKRRQTAGDLEIRG